MKPYFLTFLLILTAVLGFSQNPWTGYPHKMPFSVAYMQAVDKNVVWGIGGQDEWSSSRITLRTTDGGLTWDTSYIPVDDMYSIPGMISAVDAMHAWVVMYEQNGGTSFKVGIYATNNGGSSWTYQTSADFTPSGSFPNCVHFFNANEGWCMGDPAPSSTVFQIYTTSNGGSTWTKISNGNIAACLPVETGFISYCCSVGDTSWFGTSRGRIFRSTDKGHTWTASTISGWTASPAKPTFRDHLHGLVQNMSNQDIGNFVQTSDGGTTWQPITYSYPGFYNSLVFHNLAYVPGTPNTYIGSGYYNILTKSTDGGLNWETMEKPVEATSDFFSVWIDAKTGWLSSYNYVYKFTGNLEPPVPNFTTSDTAILTGRTASFINQSQNATSYQWSFPGGVPSASTEINPEVTYPTEGIYNVTLTATNENSITSMTRYNYIKVNTNGIYEISRATISVSPNPLTDHIIIKSSLIIRELSLTDLAGREVCMQKPDKKEISINNLYCASGLYILRLILEDGIYSMKIVII